METLLICTSATESNYGKPLFIEGNKYKAIKGSKNYYIALESEMGDCRITLPLRGGLWTFEIVDKEELK